MHDYNNGKTLLSYPSHGNSNGSLQTLTNGSSNMNIETTEGWLELFLTPYQKRTFSKWDEHVHNKSLTNLMTFSLFKRLSNFIPDNIAPNLITLCGLTCIGQAWYVTNLYGEENPTPCTWFAIFNILIFFASFSLDMQHADRIRQRTPLGTLFKYNCDSCSTVFLVLLTVFLLGGIDSNTQWYAVQATQLILFTKHLSAFHRNDGLRYNVITGPGDVVMIILTLLITRAVFGLDWFIQVYKLTFHKIIHWFDKHDIEIPDDIHARVSDPVALGSEAVMIFYYGMYAAAVVMTLSLNKPHGWSRFGLTTSLLMRFLPAIFLHFGLDFQFRVVDVICDGLFMAVLTSDVTLAKMAGREIHPWVVVMSMAAILSHSIILTLVMVYNIAVFGDLCHYLNAPLFTVSTNVYCDGVFDLCHIGHKTLFRNALAFGNRLFVGVMSDKDCVEYKRQPIMSHDERCAEVEGCKSVTKVIPNAPCFGLSPEFIELHQIHVVAFGEEYLDKYPSPDDDPYYSYPRKIGIAKPLPRTKGLSTSDIIHRIQNTTIDPKKSST